ncbi:MAG: ASKHA domain-containing protein [Syntrophobacteraceae bacterium]
MAIVSFYPDRRSIEVPRGATILQAVRKAGIMLETPCNCVGICAKCAVRLDADSLKNIAVTTPGPREGIDLEHAWVLSCQTEILGDIAVEVPGTEQSETIKILCYGRMRAVDLDPCIRKTYSKEEDKTSVFALDRLLAREPGDTRGTNLGIVVDIGTTTLVASLVDLTNGEEVCVASALNPQSLHAQDVLSRIRYASEEAGLKTMHMAVIEEINRLTGELAAKSGIAGESIYEMVFSGNTCMLHLATDRNPSSLGKFPYIPAITGGNHVSANRQGLNIAESGLVYLPPIISGFVGADITSGILATRLHQSAGTTLLVDVGTNGEMVLAGNGRLSAASTAAGPAFEGMNISCGMRAGRGAIEAFDIDEDGTIIVKTIENAKAAGICGSGLLDIVGELVAHGVIAGSGRFVDWKKSDLPAMVKTRLIEREGKTVFQAAEDIVLTQKDIRQVQLAKAAVRTGIEFLLQDAGIGPEEVDRILIAGSFGYHLQEKSLINVGLLPEEFAGKIEFVGNTSKSGGQAFLLNRGTRDEMAALVKAIQVIELVGVPDFDKVFVRRLGF